MQIIAKCPQCNYTWKLDGCAQDRRLTCCRCGNLFKVPKLDEIPKAKTIIQQARGDVYVDENGKTFG